jgi:RNA polymerase sigma factor (sigma-70 family)
VAENAINYTTEQDQFIEGFKSNDRVCLDKIYTMYYKIVERYIFKNNGDENDAKDIFQEAMIATWLNIKEEKFKPITADSLGGYIFQIARFKWLDKLKSSPHRMTNRIENDGQVQSWHEDFDASDIQEERISKLKSLYGKLDDKCKGILDRYYYQKMSLEEIGKELDHDGGTIKTLKYRCMKKLRTVYLSHYSNNI